MTIRIHSIAVETESKFCSLPAKRITSDIIRKQAPVIAIIRLKCFLLNDEVKDSCKEGVFNYRKGT